MDDLPTRFALVDEEDLHDIVAAADSKNTKKQMKYSTKIFQEYLAASGDGSLEAVTKLPNLELDVVLAKFYASARQRNGSKYTRTSLNAIRFGIQRYFLTSEKQVDIVHHPDFKNSGQIFKAVSATLKKEGKAVVKHKDAISAEDMEKIQGSFDLSTPQGLQDKVFLDIMLYFCNRGRENLRDMTVESFEEHEEGGKHYITLRDTLTKNNRQDDTEASQGGIMMEMSGNPRCPVSSFLMYKEKLNPACKWFWQRPMSVKSVSQSWYCNAPLGKNTLGEKMKKISINANCSKGYTNHCLRATSITVLDKAGFENRDIMTVSGHHSETSIKNYSRTSEEKKLQRSEAIAATISGEPSRPNVISENPVVITENSPMITNESVVIDQESASLLDFMSNSQQSQDNELQLIDQVLRDIGNSPKPMTIPVTFSTNNSQKEEHKTSQFNFQHCVVKIYNK